MSFDIVPFRVLIAAFLLVIESIGQELAFNSGNWAAPYLIFIPLGAFLPLLYFETQKGIIKGIVDWIEASSSKGPKIQFRRPPGVSRLDFFLFRWVWPMASNRWPKGTYQLNRESGEWESIAGRFIGGHQENLSRHSTAKKKTRKKLIPLILPRKHS